MATLYWVGGTGTYDGVTNKFATTSGGVASVALPTSSDDVVFDSASSPGAYTVTLTATFTCLNLTVGAGGAAGVCNLASASTVVQNVYGNMTLSGTAGVSCTNLFGSTTFRPAVSTTKVLTTNGVPFNGIILNGAGTLQLADNISLFGGNINGNGVNAAAFTQTAGTLDPNGKTVTMTGAAGIAGTATFYNLTVTMSGSNVQLRLSTGLNITVTNVLTLTGINSTLLRLLIYNVNAVGTAVSISAASVVATNCDFQDIAASGAGWNLSAATGGSGNCLGNTGITFTPAVDQHYMSIVGGNWSTAASWTSRVPLPQDDVFFDDATRGGSLGTSRTLTVDMPRIGRNITFAGATWTTAFALATGTSAWTLYGSWTMIAGITASGTGAFVFGGRSSHTFTPSNYTFNTVQVAAPGTLTLAGNLTIAATRQFGVTASGATLNTGSYDVTCGNVSALSGSTLTLGTSTVTLLDTGTAWSISAGATINAASSTIKFTNTTNVIGAFGGSGKIYGTVWFARGTNTAAITIAGSNTFTEFKDTGSVAHSLLFTAGTTQTVGAFTVSGTAGNVITLDSTTTGTYALVKSTPGAVSCDYLNIQHCVATGGHQWFAGANSVNNQAVASAGSGWVFTVVPTTAVKNIGPTARASVKNLGGADVGYAYTIGGLG